MRGIKRICRLKPSARRNLKKRVFEENIHDEAEIEKMYYQCIEAPDPVDAVNRVKRQMFLRFISSIRDERNERRPFLYTNKEGVRQIHIIPGTTDMKAVAEIEERLAQRLRGYNRARRPVRQYRHELAEQISLNFDNKEK